MPDDGAPISLTVNGARRRRAPGATLAQLAASIMPDADLALVNDIPVGTGDWDMTTLADGADVVLARRGAMPPPEDYRRLLVAHNPPGTAERLLASAVGLAGCGGLGSNAALALARMGVGRLVLVDFDIVEPTNLNRQAFFAADIGRPKAEALRGLVRNVNPLIECEAHSLTIDPGNAAGLFAGCHVVLECLDKPSAKRMLVETLLSESPSVPVVAASGLAGLGGGNAITTRRTLPNLWMVGDGESEVAGGMGLAAPRVAIAAGQQALCAVRILLGMET